MLDVALLHELTFAAAAYESVAEAWTNEGIADCASINSRAAIVCRETIDALRQLDADEHAALGIGALRAD